MGCKAARSSIIHTETYKTLRKQHTGVYQLYYRPLVDSDRFAAPQSYPVCTRTQSLACAHEPSAYSCTHTLCCMSAMRSHRTLLVLLVALASMLGALAQTCPVSYRTVPNARPYMFGGLYDGTCTSGCRDRSSYWGQICAFNPARNDMW